MVIIKRFYSHPVPRHEKGALAFVPYRESKHAVKMPQAFFAGCVVHIGYYLGVGFCPERVPLLFEFLLKIRKVINLTVVNAYIRTFRVPKRLVSSFQVDYA